MESANGLRGLAIASLLLVAFSALHCGGRVLGGTHGGGGSGGSTGSGSGGSAGSGTGGTGGTGGGGACPVSHGMGPVQVQIGDPCDWGGLSCPLAVAAGCGPGSFEDSTCNCAAGKVVCPDFIPPPCIAPVCPPQAQVVESGSCVGTLTCTSSIAEYDCSGNVTGYASCTCDASLKWSCAVSSPGCPPPPPPPPPPPTTCVNPCAPGTTCTAAGAGDCGSTRVYTCLKSGKYDPGTDPCSAGESCSNSTSCGEQVCFCYVDSSGSTGHFVCKGGC